MKDTPINDRVSFGNIMLNKFNMVLVNKMNNPDRPFGGGILGLGMASDDERKFPMFLNILKK